ncbi:uncharacterized protein (DUF2141 family) [Pseudoduganella lurida]|uniref:Uncharacterized protein (DUF2141 family) n=1 Tax=Pseudoduganella lurida TaxID=1036180 RepID=A0A562QWH5_9BURK|nr:DUF2141 domain-containing protein [Pseudoduganella lurida]TWI61132.1 uncharacterized protein (DUF2141 family) [Pseudoduganella lurida]
MMFSTRPSLRHLLTAAALCVASLQVAVAATVEVKVTNVVGKGQLKVAVCDRATFLKQCVHTASAPSTAGAMTVSVKDVPAGTWAVLVYEDANDNGKLDRTLGIPSEDYGLSRNFVPRFGPPSFDDASIEVKDDPTVVSIKLH